MQNDLPKENDLDDFEPTGSKEMWLVLLFIILPWILGIGVIGIWLMDLLDIRF